MLNVDDYAMLMNVKSPLQYFFGGTSSIVIPGRAILEELNLLFDLAAGAIFFRIAQ